MDFAAFCLHCPLHANSTSKRRWILNSRGTDANVILFPEYQGIAQHRPICNAQKGPVLQRDERALWKPGSSSLLQQHLGGLVQGFIGKAEGTAVDANAVRRLHFLYMKSRR